MRIARFQRILGLAIIVALTAKVAAAQTTTATVTGSVSDQSGAAVAEASVVLENLQTHVQSTAQTNSSGFYRVAGLLAGFYRATVTKNGFRSVVRDNIELHGQDEVALNYSLQVGSITESITVTTAEPLLQSDSATVSTVIEEQQIQNTPISGRNVMNLSGLTPGVVPQGATSGNALGNQSSIGNYTNPAGWGNYQVGGAISGSNVTYLDGAPLNLPTQNWMGFIPAQDSIQEFRVETNNISSEYGGYYGGVLNFTTKAGTNEIHGSAYEYFRNTVLDANSYFNNNTGVVRPPVEQNQYGVAIGGPLKKNKAFLFGNWEGYQNRTGLPYQTVVPSVAETTGDFTADSPIYYAGTTTQISCNGVLNKVCPDSTALYMASVYKYWAKPNIGNAAEGKDNFSTNASSGGSSNQYVFRGDYSLGSRQQLFGRYTLWKTNTLGTNYYHNNVPQPEVLSTSHQAVVGDTITLNSTTVADLRASYLRFLFTSQPPNMGHVTLSDFGSAYGALQNQVTYDVLPDPYLIGYGSEFPLLIINVIQSYDYDKYAISGSITKTFGRHALKAGASLMRNEAYLSGDTGLGPTGFFYFVSGDPTTNVFANFMLGEDIPVSSYIATARGSSSINLSQGYYVSDTYQANSRFTMTGGLRWDLPGAVAEKHDVNTVFLPNIDSPLGTIQNPATGSSQTLKGNLALVNSTDYRSRNDDNLHYDLFAPNLGFSARVLPNTVLRGGFGMSFISYTNAGVPSPYYSPISESSTPATGLLSNPFPQINGTLPQPVGRVSDFSSGVQGLTVEARIPGAKYPYVEQWNLNLQHQISVNSVFQLGYQGSKGTHIQLQINKNQLPDSTAAEAATQYTSLVASGDTTTAADAATFVNQKVSNPLAGELASGSAYNGSTISEGQLLKPYPQFSTSVTDLSTNVGSSIYHSMQATYQLRFHTAGTFFAAYTWSKLIGDVDSVTSFLEGNTVGSIQDYNNLKAERSVESFDVSQRLVLNYSLALPVGRGQHWLSNAGDGLNRVIGGWRASSITSFQSGYPLALTATSNDMENSFGSGSIRPDRVSGCNAKKSGSAKSRLDEWFNTACFAQPSTPFSFGDEGRTDSQLRGHGVNNWDLAFSKETSVTEHVRANFEAEFLNAFNRVQFGPPGLQLGGTNFGTVTSTLNNPREIQFSLRLLF
jgi:hypothetical protein